jgi:hypothetical protein
MPFKKQTPSLRGDKSKSHSDLSHHYGEIGIKAVAAATRKENESTHRNRKRKEKAQNEDEDEQ